MRRGLRKGKVAFDFAHDFHRILNAVSWENLQLIIGMPHLIKHPVQLPCLRAST